MTIRELLHELVDHAADGRNLDHEVLVRINGDVRPIRASYANGTLILVAGRPITRS